jgi:hypothetical protein
MELDYWRTRSIAEAMREGCSRLRATCPKCAHIADIPSPVARARALYTFLGNIPLKCQKCGNADPVIGVRHHGNTQG